MKGIKDRLPIHLGVRHDPKPEVLTEVRPRVKAGINRQRTHFLSQLNRAINVQLPFEPRFLEILGKPLYVIVNFEKCKDIAVHVYADVYEQRGEPLLVNLRQLYAVNSYAGKLVYKQDLQRIVIQRLSHREELTLFTGNRLATITARSMFYSDSQLDKLFGMFRNPA